MRAARIVKLNEPLQVQELQTPTINESDEVQNHNPHKNSLEDQIRNVAS
jgi:hypothetical protein